MRTTARIGLWIHGGNCRGGARYAPRSKSWRAPGRPPAGLGFCLSRNGERFRSNEWSGVVSPRNGVNILAAAKEERVFHVMPSAYPSRPGTGGGGSGRGKGWTVGPSARRPGEMTKELRRGTVAWWMGTHTFHGCFRDKRYAGRTDTRENEPREEQSASPGSLVLQPHANPFASSCKRRRRRRVAPLPAERARAQAATVLALQFRQYAAIPSRLNLS